MGISIKDYVEQRGVQQVAVLCRVTPQTIYNWVNKETYPEPVLAHLMIEDSMSMLSYENIYKGYVLANYTKVIDHKAKPYENVVKA